AYEAPRRGLGGLLPTDGVGQGENEWLERGSGLTRVRGEIRASWIVDPPDGRIPYRPETGLAGGATFAGVPARMDNPEDLNGSTRCLFSALAGAPMGGTPD